MPIRWAMRLLREPLLHFLLLGAALFGLHVWLQRGAAPAAAADNVILVSDESLRHLVESFTRERGRAPTRAEFDLLLEAHLREEVLVREALRLELDRDDGVIRQRLREKLEALANTTPREPSEAELESHYQAIAEQLRAPGALSFTQVFLDAERRGVAAATLADPLLQALLAPNPPDPTTLGDLGPMPLRLVGQPWEVVSGVFGSEFAQPLQTLPVGIWQGPLPSRFGWHLVRIEALIPGPIPTYTEARPRVLEDWRSRELARAREAQLEQLRTRWEVRRDPRLEENVRRTLAN